MAARVNAKPPRHLGRAAEPVHITATIRSCITATNIAAGGRYARLNMVAKLLIATGRRDVTMISTNPRRLSASVEPT
jgi:hypothetical protein